jgi:hypothetical protein
VAAEFDRFIGVDWSGAATRSGQRIYIAEAHRRDALVTVNAVVRARDRDAVEAWLRGAPLEHAPAWEEWPGPSRVDRRSRWIVALDFAFGFPAGFRHPHGDGDWGWSDLGAWAAALDQRTNGSPEPVRAAIAADPGLARQFRLEAGHALPKEDRRLTDRLAPRRTESVFHLIGPSQVGVGSITGIAMLHRLRDAERLAVWPFDPPDRIDGAGAVLVEVFPRMWLGPGIRKNELPERVRQLEAWQHEGIAFRGKAELAAASSGDALDAVAAAIGAARSCYRLPSPEAVPAEARRREGWIAGVQVPG